MLFGRVNADVRISNLNDYNFGAVIPTGVTQTIEQAVCVYNNQRGANSNYTITATGINTINGSFQLFSERTFIAYNVYWQDNGSNFVSLTPGLRSPTFFNPNNSSSDCSRGQRQPGTLRIQITGATLSTTPLSGTYVDTLTLLMAPA